MNRADLTEKIRRALTRRVDVRVAVLFGSEARGTARPGSDVDAMLETDRPWYARMRDAWLTRVREKGSAHG